MKRAMVRATLIVLLAAALSPLTPARAEPRPSVDDICRTLRVGRSTLYRYLADAKRR